MFECLSDFKLVGKSEFGIVAKVKCRSISSLYLKQVERNVFKPSAYAFWVFEDSGDYTPGFQVEAMYRMHLAKQEMQRLGLDEEMK